MSSPEIFAPLSAVIAAAADETMFRLVMPGATRTVPQLFGADEITIDATASSVRLLNQRGEHALIQFYEVDAFTTSYKIRSNGNNIKSDLFVDILKNHTIGLKIADSLQAQRQFKRYITAVVLGLPIVLGILITHPTALQLSWNTWNTLSISAIISDIIFYLYIVIIMGLIMSLFLSRFLLLLLGTLAKRLFFQRRLDITEAGVIRLLEGTVERLRPYLFAKRFPEITKTIQYPYGEKLLELDPVTTLDPWAMRHQYQCSMLRIHGFQLFQLRKDQVVWHIPLHSSFAHSYIARKNKPIKKLERFRLELEGDFQNYFNFYTAAGQHIEALRLATPEVMQAMVDHAQPFDLEIRDNHMYVHSPLKHFFDPLWITRSLTTAQRIASEIDTRGDKPTPYKPLPKVYELPLSESPAKLFLIAYGILAGAITLHLIWSGQFFELEAPIMTYLALLIFPALMILPLYIHLIVWYNQYSLGLGGLVTLQVLKKWWRPFHVKI